MKTFNQLFRGYAGCATLFPVVTIRFFDLPDAGMSGEELKAGVPELMLAGGKGAKISALREIAHEKMAEKIRSGLSETETAILTGLLKKIVICFLRTAEPY